MTLKEKHKINKTLRRLIKTNMVSEEGLNLLKSITNPEDRIEIIKSAPMVFPYVMSAWKNNNPDLDATVAREQIYELAELAVSLYPENLLKFGKAGIVVDQNLVQIAMRSKPAVVFKFNDDMKQYIAKEFFVECFVKDPTIITADLKVLKNKFTFKVDTFDEQGQPMVKKVLSSVRTECLKAMRLALGVSEYHKGFDDLAMSMAKKLKKVKLLQSQEVRTQFEAKLPTYINALIKLKDSRLRACPPETWVMNNNKTLYQAVRESSKAKSPLKDLLGDIATTSLSEKTKRKAIAEAIKIDPTIFEKLEEYSLAEFIDDDYIKYVRYVSCLKHNNPRVIEQNFTQEDIAKSKAKVQRLITRKQKAEQKNQTAAPETEQTK